MYINNQPFTIFLLWSCGASLLAVQGRMQLVVHGLDMSAVKVLKWPSQNLDPNAAKILWQNLKQSIHAWKHLECYRVEAICHKEISWNSYIMIWKSDKLRKHLVIVQLMLSAMLLTIREQFFKYLRAASWMT